MEFNSEDEQYARDFATEAEESYFEMNGEIDERRLNSVIASIVDENLPPRVSDLGKVTTTRHNEKIIFYWDYEQGSYEVGSFELEVSKKLLEFEQLEKEERVDRFADWILSRSEQVYDEVVEMVDNQY